MSHTAHIDEYDAEGRWVAHTQAVRVVLDAPDRKAEVTCDVRFILT